MLKSPRRISAKSSIGKCKTSVSSSSRNSSRGPGGRYTTTMMEHVSFPALSRVAICGGTHGNEMSGICLVRDLQKRQVKKVGSVSLTTVLSNPRAMEACRRYMDTDLNRCFTNAQLSAQITDDSPYEVRRAQQLNIQLGPKGSQEGFDLVFDLHNTTANVDLCLLFHASDQIALHLYKYIQEKITSVPVRCILMQHSLADAYSLDSLGKHGLSIEIGPQPNGVIRADIFHLMKDAVDKSLDWVQSFNSGNFFEGSEMEAYVLERSVDYPRDPKTHEITAAIHPQLQDNDFCLLKPGDPIFLSFSGETIIYDGKELHPFFVNECAYYEKKIAFHLARKITLTVPSISVKKD
ncbi:N-acyl-aromatic-L-amino acid amidohydrolase (carboxylate-forming) B-like isoform X2 [Lampris incognitus]|uniref:N-acyl-aromatic-L-amino acid amidohydrolase (carboxylate-forming) B-like isoform X2 n=1 Tax=Lampris incognitus TaxID=2546036 RepID=UPI0024B58B5A|nr:N-acyl-aromatic-L-amino acid amidohydrolase (carboxylate-forming) B-like isoform X2 [Lampris incognitus]